MTALRSSCWLLLLGLGLGACGGEGQSAAEFRLEYGGLFANPEVGALSDVRAELEVLLNSGQHAVANVQFTDPDTLEPATEVVQSPLPVPCSGGVCNLSFGVPPGAYRFTLRVWAKDRCGREALVAAFRPPEEGPVRLLPYSATLLELSRATYAFDDDGDNIENVLELQVCGRTDWDDGARAARRCVEGHPCCRDDPGGERGSVLVGEMSYFAGGSWPGPDGNGRTVDPFWLDATEATWGQFARCVAAGACLYGQPDHPARLALATADKRAPVTGLRPTEALSFCAWQGKRLPYDEEWDFAAAAREDPSVRGAFPFSASAGETLVGTGRIGDTDHPETVAQDEQELFWGCRPGTGALALNHRQLNQDCEGAPLPVGQFPSTFVHRGQGAPVADLAGNVWEWTLQDGVADLSVTDPEAVLPGDVEEVYMRGGHFGSTTQLLRNDFRYEIGPADFEVVKSEVDRLKEVVGVRCAAPASSFTPDETPEPMCGP